MPRESAWTWTIRSVSHACRIEGSHGTRFRHAWNPDSDTPSMRHEVWIGSPLAAINSMAANRLLGWPPPSTTQSPPDAQQVQSRVHESVASQKPAPPARHCSDPARPQIRSVLTAPVVDRLLGYPEIRRRVSDSPTGSEEIEHTPTKLCRTSTLSHTVPPRASCPGVGVTGPP